MTHTIAVPSRALLIETLSGLPFVEAAAIYGSAARGDMEPHSDIDLLLLCSSGRKRDVLDGVHTSLSCEFSKLSVALYSMHELEFLNRAHSLFLLHLKREADILFDRDGRFSALLSNFSEKASYRSDFVESLSLLDPLRTAVARSPNHLHRLSYAYSLFRVFGVYLLAERQIFEFSKSRMASCLSREYPSAREAISMLSELRVLNSNFFSGGVRFSSERARRGRSLQDYIYCLSDLTAVPTPITERSFREAVEEFAANAASQQHANYKLRTWFLLLVYDGLNLYRGSCGQQPLTSLDAGELEQMSSVRLPSVVRTAVAKGLGCIRDYRCKYFLNSKTKISTVSATEVLCKLADEV
jgi:predicted nucleotidyltransferase